MAEYSYKAECVVPQALIQRIKFERKIVSAEQIVKSNGLDWRTPFKMSDHVTIAGPSDDILKFVIECLETMLDKDRNPSCFLLNRKVKFHFLDTLGEKIFKSRKELQQKYLPLEIEKVPGKYIQLVCSFDGYSKIRQTVDKIRDSKPLSNFVSDSLDKSLVGEQIGYLVSSSTPLLANNHSAFSYSFSANKIKVSVYIASIIEVNGIDAIVSAADEDLDNNGGIARVISAAAGTSVETECLNYLIQHGRVKVGNCCVTGPGNLKHLKGIIHAVGPRWDAYLDQKKCAIDLHETLVHVLQTAHERKFQKIAVTPISSGKRSVPLDVCAEMYVKAVMDYSRDATPNGITEVHFVDLFEDSLREIKKAHEKWLKCQYMLDSKKVLKHATYDHGWAKPREGASYSFSNKNVTGYRMPWKYKEEEKKEELAEHFSWASLDAKLHEKETHGNQCKAGNDVSWMRTGNGGKTGNLPIFGVEAGELKTVNKLKIEKSGETCISDKCDRTAEETLSCGHKFCEICVIPLQTNHLCTVCSQKSFETTMGASLINTRKVTNMSEASSNSVTCIICMEKLTIPYKLPCVHDSFHEKCIKDAFVYMVCPVVGRSLEQLLELS